MRKFAALLTVLTSVAMISPLASAKTLGSPKVRIGHTMHAPKNRVRTPSTNARTGIRASTKTRAKTRAEAKPKVSSQARAKVGTKSRSTVRAKGRTTGHGKVQAKNQELPAAPSMAPKAIKPVKVPKITRASNAPARVQHAKI